MVVARTAAGGILDGLLNYLSATILELSSSQHLDSEAVDPDMWVDAYGDYLYRYAVSRLREPADAEEAVQETFLAAIGKQHQFKGRGNQRSWLLGILKRKILTLVRNRHRNRANPIDEDTHDATALLFDERGCWLPDSLPAINSETQVELNELQSIVANCLSKLPQIQADVFMLSVMEGMENEEICKELGISASNLWVRMHRARLGLAKCVSTRWFDEAERGVFGE